MRILSITVMALWATSAAADVTITTSRQGTSTVLETPSGTYRATTVRNSDGSRTTRSTFVKSGYKPMGEGGYNPMGH
jgi:hypothetical protein